ncbi:hypothetical protein [Streptomyces xiamenensis]|uniref:hypothetical protein n=1 Tax=Streptomyces xiamenensis TaxID=408015 RepID=UPI0035D892FB
MPTTFAQLSAGGKLTSLRTTLRCEGTTALLRQGPPSENSATPDWLLFLCPEHSEDLPGWPGTPADIPDRPQMVCGFVMDYRSTEQVLRSHAALWITPVTGVDPATCAGGWPEFLDRAHSVLAGRAAEAGDEEETLNSVTMMLRMAAEDAEAGDLHQATSPLALGETLAQHL